MAYNLEPMSDQHRRGVIDIYNYYVLNSFAAYPEQPVGYDFFDRFLQMAQGYPALVVEHEAGGVVGFALLQAFHPAVTFRRSAQITYFIRPEHTGQGLGTMILERFIEQARERGIESILAHVSSRNEGSLRFHRRRGFRECGRLRHVGKKFDQDFDVVWWQLELEELDRV
jgi:phosphinothricin acetyltransferase